MPKNKGAGGKKRRKGKSDMPQEMVYKVDGQEYAQVTKSLGNAFMEVMCFTSEGNISRRAHIRGTMRKRAWMTQGDIVLVNCRDFQESTYDIVLKYNLSEARTLRSKRLIPDNIDLKSNKEEEDPFQFTDKGNGSDDEMDDGNGEITNKKGVAQQVRNLDMPPSESESESDNSVDLNKLL